MALFRKKPVVIEAMQFRGPNITEVDHMVALDDWLVANAGDRKCRYIGNRLIIITLEGDMEALPGDWIIKGVNGEIYPCKPDIFLKTYDAVD